MKRQDFPAIGPYIEHMNVRAKVTISVLNSNQVLLAEIHDPGRGIPLYLPVGGGVEFQELIRDAARRELKEETGIESDIEYCSFTENFFEFDGVPAHEIVFHFFARIDDETRAALPEFGTESDGERFPINWYSLKALHEIRESVVPEGIYEKIVSRLTCDHAGRGRP